MKKIISLFLVLLIVATSLMGCSDRIEQFGNGTTNIPSEGDTSQDGGGTGNGTGNGSNNGTGNGSGNGGTTNTDPLKPFEGIPEPGKVDFSKADADMFTTKDDDTIYNEAKAIKIKLDGENGPVASSNTVIIKGNKITITEDKTHVISGTLADGQIVINVDATAKPHIILNNVNLTSQSSAPIYVVAGEKVFITLIGDNTLANGGTFTQTDSNNVDGVIYSKQDLTFNGEGSLTISSPAGHGIVCNDDLVFTGGTFNITAASHGVNANDSVRIKQASITADAGKDGIHVKNNVDTTLGFFYMSSGKLDLTAQGDGISASAHLQINDGEINILAGGGYENGDDHSSSGWGGFPGNPGGRPPRAAQDASTSSDDSSTSMKGIKSTGGMLISGGILNINSADDAIHSNASVTINGGDYGIKSGDDAIHADNTLVLTDATIKVEQSYEGIEAMFIYVQGGKALINATDDGINAAGGRDNSGTGGRDDMFGTPDTFGAGIGTVSVSGGELEIKANGDGIDVNGALEIKGGKITVTGPTSGDTAVLDYDTNGVIRGGTFIGTGSRMMAQTFSEASQGVISLSVGNQAQGTQIIVCDKSGNVVLQHTPELSYQIVIISSPDLISGESYTVKIGDQTNEFVAD